MTDSYNSSFTGAQIDAAVGAVRDKEDDWDAKVDPGDLATVATSGAYSDLSGQPTNLNQFTNGPGYITGITSSMVTTALGYTPPAQDTNTTYTLGTSGDTVTLTPSSGSVQSITVPYATSASSADTATGDSSGNNIDSNYAHSLSISGTTVTLKDMNGDTLSTGTTQDTNYTYALTKSSSGDSLLFWEYTGSSTTSTEIQPEYAYKAECDIAENSIRSSYASSLTTSGNTVLLKSNSGGTLSTVTVPYATSAGSASSATSAGTCTGNSATATKATGDASGNTITTSYAASLTTSGNNVLLKSKSGAQLSSITVPYATSAGSASSATSATTASTFADSSVSWTPSELYNWLTTGASSSAYVGKAAKDGSGNTITSTYAKLASDNNLVAHGNEFNFASSAFSGTMWINYRTASGTTDGSINQYNLGNGAGGTLGIFTNGQYNGNAATATYATSAGSAPASDVYSWAKASSKPSYTMSYTSLGSAVYTGSTSFANYSSYDFFIAKGTVSGGGRQTAIVPKTLFDNATGSTNSCSFTLTDQDDACFYYVYHSGTTGYIVFRGRSSSSGVLESFWGVKIS